MKLAHRYSCDQCGTVAPWGDTWQRYSSLRHDETCPELMPALCSETCRDLFLARLGKGEIELPKLSNHRYYSSVRVPGKGYGISAVGR